MTQKLIKTDKATILLLLLPEDAELIGRMDDNYWSYHSKSQGWGKFPIKGNWQPLGFAKEVSEEQAILIAENIYFQGHLQKELFENYLDKSKFFSYALPALHSLLQANEVYLENRMGTEPENRLEW